MRDESWFKPTLSLDGVAIIVGIFAAGIGYGLLKSEADTNRDTTVTHTQEIRQLEQITTKMDAIINERERQHPPL